MTPTVPPPMRDDELDRLLEAAMSVSPSPTFRARVAARLSEEPLPGRRRPSVFWPAMVAATAFAIAIAVGNRPPADEGRRVQQSTIAGTASWIVAAPAASVERRAPARRMSMETLRSRLVVVRFDRREQDTFAWLVRRATAGDLAPSEREIENIGPDPVVPPLDVPPIEVAPIGLAGDSEGDPQP